MDINSIKQLGPAVLPLLDDDAYCWLWVTNGTIPQGLEVLEAFGFTYRSLLTHVKPRLGLGRYLRNMTEHVMLGTRGKPPIKFRSQGTWFFAPVQDHSHKPEEAYDIIERLCGDGARLELFARDRRPGWHVWGDEVESDISIPGFPVPSDFTEESA